jgi:uncharacterized protein YutE (UPF0331/DUF86 family)
MSEAHLALLREMLDLLERYATTVTRPDLERDRETWLKVRGALEIAAQCCIDLALAIIAQRALAVPQTYREAFTTLARAGVIDGALAGDLESWAGLRNVLAHMYTALDLDRIHAALGATAPLRAFGAVAARELGGG